MSYSADVLAQSPDLYLRLGEASGAPTAARGSIASPNLATGTFLYLMAVEINSIEASAWVIAKINSTHRLSLRDVEHALENITRAGFEEHEEYGRRLLLRCRTARGVMRIILFPIDETAGTYRLGSAFY